MARYNSDLEMDLKAKLLLQTPWGRKWASEFDEIRKQILGAGKCKPARTYKQQWSAEFNEIRHKLLNSGMDLNIPIVPKKGGC